MNMATVILAVKILKAAGFDPEQALMGAMRALCGGLTPAELAQKLRELEAEATSREALARKDAGQ